VIMMIVIVTEEMIGTLSERWISVNSLGFAEKVTHPPGFTTSWSRYV